MATLSELSDAVATYLGTLELDGEPTIAKWLPQEQLAYDSLENLSGVKIVVVPYGVTQIETAEGIDEVRQEIRIVVQRKISAAADYEAAAAITERIVAALVGTTLLDRRCVEIRMTPAVDYGRMAEMAVYDAVAITNWLTYE